jgi:Zn-dependent protease
MVAGDRNWEVIQFRPCSGGIGREAGSMFTQIELGRVFGIPVRLDMFFILVLILLNAGYWRGGDAQSMSMGFVICAGILASILLHELGHALVGRLFGAEVSQIDLGGFGGTTHFTRSLRSSVIVRSAIYLAGPLANLALWQGLVALVDSGVMPPKPLLLTTLYTLASINFYLMVFNLLPAFPLDGGQTLDAWLGAVIGPTWSTRIVAGLGLALAVVIAVLAFPSNFWMLIVAFALFQANYAAWTSVGGYGRRG